MSELHILSLGAGVQSTALYMLAVQGELHLDYAIFADTQDEPQAVYRHLDWLHQQKGPPIIVRSKGRLSDDLMRGSNSTGQRFASVPFFADIPGAKRGMVRRQCSSEYKIVVVERSIRRDCIGLRQRQRIPKRTTVHQYFGISLDEARRSLKIRERVKPPQVPHFPLLDLRWTRADCLRFLEPLVPHEVPRSACVYCPFHSDREWLRIKAVPEDWELAVRVDRALREPGRIVNRNMDATMYAHSTLVPLDQVEFRHERQLNMFTLECEGACGV